MPGKVFVVLGTAASIICMVALVVALDAASFHLFSPTASRSGTALMALEALALGGAAVASLGLGLGAAASRLRTERRLQRRLRGLPLVDVGGVPVVVVPGEAVRAFCAGLLRPRVFVSQGAVDQLDAVELAAIVSHEAHHAARRDPLRLAAVDVVARAMFFVPGLHELAGRCRVAAELQADAAAERAQGASPLAAALLRFSEDPAAGVSADRVHRLLGEPVAVGVPLVRLLPALASTAVALGLVAVLIWATGCADLDVSKALERPEFLAAGLAALGTVGAAMSGGVLAAPARRRVARR